MYTIEVNQTLDQFFQVFYIFGIWQSDEESTIRKSVKMLCYPIFIASFVTFLATNAFICKDKNESIFCTQMAVMAVVIFVKCMYLLFKKREILEFLHDQAVVHSIEDHEEYEQVYKKIKMFVKFIRTYAAVFAITAFSVIGISLPIFPADKRLPMFISLSWQDSDIIYWLSFVAISLGIFGCYISNLITVLIWYIMLNYSIEYQVLGNKFRYLGVGVEKIKKTTNHRHSKWAQKNASLSEKNSKLSSGNFFVENLINSIKAHRNLTETIERFKSFFSTLFLFQMTTSGIITCVALYNLAYISIENIIQMQMFIAILLYGISDIFSVMYLANEITAASDRLSYSLFESDWIEQTESCKKFVLIMGEVLKQPQQLVIFIYPMNLETFTSIINGGYSMFNILKNFK